MKKYWQIAKITFSETTAYRLNFVMWRVRVVLQLLTIYFLWQAILPRGAKILNYDHSQILTYILGTSLIWSFVMASRSQSIADEINSGSLSNFLIKPINYFSYHFFRDIGDKAMNILFTAVELTLMYFILKPPIFIQTDPTYLALALISIFAALCLHFFINFILGTIGFISPEIWAPRFIFFIVIGFFAGSYFPLDILPANIFAIFKFLPFTYLLYFPLKVYLGQLPIEETIVGIFTTFIWTAVFALIANLAWRKGLKLYTSWGK